MGSDSLDEGGPMRLVRINAHFAVEVHNVTFAE